MDGNQTGQDGEDGISMLLRRSYQRVEPNAEFRQTLLDKLKGQQRQRLRRKTRARILYLFSSVGAAAAVVALTVMPSLSMQPSPSSQQSQSAHVGQAPVLAPVAYSADSSQTAPLAEASAPIPAAAATPVAPSSLSMSIPEAQPARPDVVFASSGSAASTGGVVVSQTDSSAMNRGVSADAETISATAFVQPASAGSDDVLDLATVKTVQALDTVEVRNPGQTEWTQLTRGAEFSPVDGTVIRTSGESSTGLKMAEGSFIVLDQRGMIRRTAGGYALDDGCAMVSLSGSRLDLQLRNKSIRIPQSTRVFAQVQGGQQYAPGGEPAPVVVVMDGSVMVPSLPQRPLLAGYAYRLYDTPTGILPHHEMGGLERERFTRMGNVMLTGFEQ